MPIAYQNLLNLLYEKFPDAVINLSDLAGDDNHYSVSIASNIFIGKTKIQQHQLVNQALKDILGTTLHALQIKTKAP